MTMVMYSPEVLYILGALRDGSVYHDKAARNYVIVFYQKNKTWLDEVLKPMVVSVSGKNPTVDEYKPGQYRLRIYSKRFYHLLKDVYGFPVNGRGQTHWEITPTLRTTEPETLIPFIRGFFDVEGDVTVNRRSPYIGFSQKNVCVLTFVEETLVKLGIKSGNLHIIDQKSQTSRFVIASKQDMIKFANLIGSLHPDKLPKLQALARILGQHT